MLTYKINTGYYIHSFSRRSPSSNFLQNFRMKRKLLGYKLGIVRSVSEQSSYLLPNGLVNYYDVLGIDKEADFSQIKCAYRDMVKQCHPDYMGEVGHKISILLNEAYTILGNKDSRYLYDLDLVEAMDDEDKGYSGQPLSEWVPQTRPTEARNTDPQEQRAVFVDELSCIGCKNCTFCAPNSFVMESVDGRARVSSQWIDTEDTLQSAIDSCPVDCIHWVNKQELPALEYLVQKKLKKTNVATLMTGAYVVNVFVDAKKFERSRRQRQQEMKKKSSSMEKTRRMGAVDEVEKVHAWLMDMFGNLSADSVPRKDNRTRNRPRPRASILKERALVPIQKN
eukprot:TRINITY_DN2499_c0_g1_i2.p1 TRINITY_DN2499_c0_g1~~TRINITY_DN2499_c0_g1_i2.p1  ORF type:complete len:338 (-),score=27.68 TRINITY_DN2499_c0_g1_i2:281-1294(-)